MNYVSKKLILRILPKHIKNNALAPLGLCNMTKYLA